MRAIQCGTRRAGCSAWKLLSIIAVLVLASGRLALAGVPAAPSNLTVEALSPTEFRLSWHDNSYNEERFVIWACPPPSPWLHRCFMIAELPPNTTTYDASLPPDVCRIFRIYAVNGDGDSEPSNEVEAVFLDEPSFVARAASADRIELAWEDVSRCEDGYEVQRSNYYPGYISRYLAIADLPQNSSTYTDTSVVHGAAYGYRVLVKEGTGDFVSSNCDWVIAYAPENLTATPVTATHIDLTWDDGLDGEDGYTVARSALNFATSQWGEWLTVSDLPENTTGYSDDSVATGTLYRYRVRAHMGYALSAWSDVVVVMAVALPPLPPSELTASHMSSSQIDLTWQDDAINETGFKIERKPQGGTYSEVAQVGADTTGYSDTDLDPATTYCYCVRAYNGAGNSAYSNESCATTSAVPPNGPSDLTAVAVSADRIDITWVDNSNDEIGFKIGRKPEGGVFTQIAVVGANTTSYSNTGLSPETACCYLILAYNAAGNSTPSNEACATTLADGGPPASAPDAPSGLSAVAVSASRIDLSWDDDSDNEAGFYIERKPQGGSYAQIAVVMSDATSYADTDVGASTTYCYRVRAYNGVGESAYCSEACATTAGVAPSAPSDLHASVGSSSQIDLAWQDNSDDEAGFRIERKPQDGGYGEIAAVGADTTSHSDAGLVTGTAYCYRVVAHNAAGDSGYCAEVCAIAFAPDLTATAVGSSRIDLAWNDDVSGEDGYAVQRRMYATGVGWGDWAAIAAKGENTTAHADTSVVSGGLYQYRVQAYKDAADSAWSNTATASATDLPPAAPSSLTANAVSPTQIDLAWQDNASNEEGFKIERAEDGGVFAQIDSVGPNATGFSDAGRTVDTPYCYRVRSFNAVGDSDPSNEACATTADGTPPVPDPLTWSLPPHATGVGSVTMMATLATDPSGVEYFFDETSGHPGGDDSGWQSSPTYVDSGLQPGTEYCYRVAARDQSSFSNRTAWSSAECALPATVGDINGDGVMNLIDVVMLYRHAEAIVDLIADKLSRADIDGDGDVDEDDVEALVQLVFGP